MSSVHGGIYKIGTQWCLVVKPIHGDEFNIILEEGHKGGLVGERLLEMLKDCKYLCNIKELDLQTILSSIYEERNHAS